MKFHFFSSSKCNPLGFGDHVALQQLCLGLKQHGHICSISENPSDCIDADYVFLSNVYTDLNPKMHLLHLLEKPFHLIPFYEDIHTYLKPCLAFFAYHYTQLKNPSSLSFQDFLNRFQLSYRNHNQLNHSVVQSAVSCLTNSYHEKTVLMQDHPNSDIQVIHWPAGQTFDMPEEDFLSLCNLKYKEYIIQIGRMEPRKNQIASILATQHLEVPLVLVSSIIFKQHIPYAKTCIEIAKQQRKAPVIILSQDLSYDISHPFVKTIHLNKPLSSGLLLNAYKSALVNLHPAFYELPGFTTLESIKLGTPTIASNWSTLKAYLRETRTQIPKDHIQYVDPTNIENIKKNLYACIEKSFPSIESPIYSYTPQDMAKEFLSIYGQGGYYRCENRSK